MNLDLTTEDGCRLGQSFLENDYCLAPMSRAARPTLQTVPGSALRKGVVSLTWSSMHLAKHSVPFATDAQAYMLPLLHTNCFSQLLEVRHA